MSFYGSGSRVRYGCVCTRLDCFNPLSGGLLLFFFLFGLGS